MDSFFYLAAEETQANFKFLRNLEAYCSRTKTQAYVVSRPLGDNKYSYAIKDSFVVLAPKHKIAFVDFSGEQEAFATYVEDFTEDLGSLSDKYRYKEVIGRPRKWAAELTQAFSGRGLTADGLMEQTFLADPQQQRLCELLISLLTGSVNDIDKVSADIPQTLLEKVKNKIVLFDGDQTRFIYQRKEDSPVRIQGLSGTGKTELLLHKLKDIYLSSDKSRVVFTCHNRILAESMRRRIPEFFTFMKVEQQIKWNERLWCMHAWGSGGNKDSGTYRYICDFYNIPYFPYGVHNFDQVCRMAITELKARKELPYAFDFTLIDESQDFPESFFELCNMVTRDTVYIAGDIFQSIFDERPRSVEPDFLLSKCYRTDPRTLMFAHALGMGIFETPKLRWLEDDEWKACGYQVEKLRDGKYRLKREPLRRFEDVERENLPSVELVKTPGHFYTQCASKIIEIIRTLKEQNPTLTPDDIGIILMDKSQGTYHLADLLEQILPREIGFSVNKAYETKRRAKGTLFVSNRNNVKGLEFPFVICVTEQIHSSYSYRNSLYMTLTRSFLQTYVVLSEPLNRGLLSALEGGLAHINATGQIEIAPPSDKEKAQIKLTIKVAETPESYFDFLNSIFDELKVKPEYREPLSRAIKNVAADDFDRENVKEIVAFNYKKMLQR